MGEKVERTYSPSTQSELLSEHVNFLGSTLRNKPFENAFPRIQFDSAYVGDKLAERVDPHILLLHEVPLNFAIFALKAHINQKSGQKDQKCG